MVHQLEYTAAWRALKAGEFFTKIISWKNILFVSLNKNLFMHVWISTNSVHVYRCNNFQTLMKKQKENKKTPCWQIYLCVIKSLHCRKIQVFFFVLTKFMKDTSTTSLCRGGGNQNYVSLKIFEKWSRPRWAGPWYDLDLSWLALDITCRPWIFSL